MTILSTRHDGKDTYLLKVVSSHFLTLFIFIFILHFHLSMKKMNIWMRKKLSQLIHFFWLFCELMMIIENDKVSSCHLINFLSTPFS